MRAGNKHLPEDTRQRARRDDWETPADLFEKLNAIFKFGLDAAASAKNAKCKDFISVEENSLLVSWKKRVKGRTVFINPPYGHLRPWLEKIHQEAAAGVKIVAVLPASVDAKWFRDHVDDACSMWVAYAGRIWFEMNGEPIGSAMGPSAIVLYNYDQKHNVIEKLREFGTVHTQWLGQRTAA